MKSKAVLTEGPINKSIMKLTFGMMVGMYAMVMFNLVDTFFIGQLGTTYLAAMSFTFPVVMIYSHIGLGLGVGASAVISRAIGNGDHETVQRLTTGALILGFGIAVIMIVLGLLTIDPVFRALGAKGEILGYIKDYMFIWYIGVPFVVIPMMGNNAIRAAGNTAIPSTVMIIGMTVNGIIDPILIFGLGPFPRMELKGAAIATVFARLTTFAVTLLFLKYKFKMISFAVIKINTIFDTWRRVLFIGIPASLTQFIVPISMGIITRMVSGYGEEAVAALGVGTRIEMFALAPIFSLGTVILAFAGQNIGAKNFDRLHKGIKFSHRFSMITGAILFIGLAFSGKYIAMIFDNNVNVIQIIVLYLILVSAGYGFQGIMFVTANTFNAMHKPYKAMSMNAIRMFGLYVPLAWLGSYFWDLPGLFAGVGLSAVIGGIIAMIWVNRAVVGLKTH
ncbi:MAG: MATE family efflux transporter [Candidatus Delongbacteria bacterium]|nr:MATE family efflux transporter [Candidatus Delongbacteria bacterium]